MPQLIVGLDSNDEAANYIHIDDVKDNINYYCPCCKGIIKPRAYKKNEEYLVQPHFYHETDGCSEETYIHYICKNWLFEKGCEFIVNNVKYTVENIEVEKTLYTSFGKYKPDIIVTTTTGKIFYFEIKTVKKKNKLYAPKWDELGNDVIEVDTRYFINQKYESKIPEFKCIYSDGICYIKSYSKNDYERIIASRKKEWKRQDKINYKIHWERLDWFWIELQNYFKNLKSKDDVLKSFDALDYTDKLWCYYTITKRSCIDLKNSFKEHINNEFTNLLTSLEDDKIKITLKHVSPKIYEIHCKAVFLYLDYSLHEEEIVKVKIQKGDILPLDCESKIRKCILKIKDYLKYDENIINRINHLTSLPYIKSIVPYSHYASETYPLHTIKFNIEFFDNIHNQYIKELIGKESIISNQITETNIENLYNTLKREALVKLENEFIEYALINNQLYQAMISDLQVFCNKIDYLQINVSGDNRRITLLNGHDCIFRYEYTKQDLFGIFEDKVRTIFISHIENQIKQHEKICLYIHRINQCQNKLWKITNFDGNFITLHLFDPLSNKEIRSINISLCKSKNIEHDIYNGMRSLLEYSENYCEIRFLAG